MIEKVTDNPPALPTGFYLIASKRTMAGQGPGLFPRYVYREEPDDPADSGWRVLIGDETQEDADDADAFQINAVETLTEAHPALRQIIARGVRGTWEWDEKADRYVQVED